MSFTVIFTIAAVIIAIGFFVTLTLSGIIFVNVFRQFRRHTDLMGTTSLDGSQRSGNARRRALDALSELPPGSPAGKCRNCGATVDSTAELSPDGRIRCNYCNEWSSIYQ